jgi:hypothetical protein
VQDSSKPAPELPEESGTTIDLSEEIRPWWRRSPPLAASAALAIGLGTRWFADMLGRVPLDDQTTFGYLLMLPLLLIVPAFSAAGLRLAWLAYAGRESSSKYAVVALTVSAAIVNWLAIADFAQALWRIFAH